MSLSPSLAIQHPPTPSLQKSNAQHHQLHEHYHQLLKQCIRTRNLPFGRRLHLHLLTSNSPLTPLLSNSLISLYSKCGHWDLARSVFDQMGHQRNVVSYTAMISAAAHHNEFDESHSLFLDLLRLGLWPNEYTFSSIIKSCTMNDDVEFGLMVLAFAFKVGFCSRDLSVGCDLIKFFAKTGDLVSARKVFDGMTNRNAVAWSLMIARYAQSGLAEDALNLFVDMETEGFEPDEFTMSSVISACVELNSIKLGRQLHCLAITYGMASNVCVACSIVDMYTKCRDGNSLGDSRKVFDRMSERNVMAWTAIISGHVQKGGHDVESLKLFLEMIHGSVRPNHFTYSSILKACANTSDAQLGEQIHARVVKSGAASVNFVGNSLVSMYTRAGKMEEARRAFDSLLDKNLVTYNAIVDGYLKNSNSEEAFELVQQIENMDVGLNAFTFASLLSAAASIGVMCKGQQLHAQLLKAGFESDRGVGNALVSMYSRCGNIEDASRVFEEMSDHDVISWTSMISGYAKHGYGDRVLELFYKMVSQGIRPNEVTYIAVLSACSHVGLVGAGKEHFASMQRDYGIVPRMEHYACLVDLLGRSGSLEEAMDVIHLMPFEADALVWRTLLSACRVHRNIELGEIAARHIIELEPEDPAAYILLSNLYAMAGKWEDVATIRRGMKERSVSKEAGLSWVEINNNVYNFCVGDTSHAEAHEIFEKLDELAVQIKALGYVADKEFVLHDVEDELKEQYLWQHSEKIAVAFGLISTNSVTPIRVFKNLRVCGDCHNAIKLMSKATGREIVLRDSNRFHRFSNGECSCKEYW